MAEPVIDIDELIQQDELLEKANLRADNPEDIDWMAVCLKPANLTTVFGQLTQFQLSK
jgi:hypothetical protein